MKKSPLFVASVASIWLSGLVASAQTTILSVISPDNVTVSQPLRDGRDDSNENDRKVRNHHLLPKDGASGDHDDALQSSAGPVVSAVDGARFAGVGANGFAPPDTNMAVGPNHILQTVNSRYAIYNKSGTLISGPFSLSSLWAPLGSGNGCATQNAGDVVAQYDKLANRFLVTQLGGTAAPYSECIAISQTPDPTGAYWLYSYSYGSTLNDYPKFGVWPTATNGAYLYTANLFANGASFIGAQTCAFDRTKMLVGDPTAQGICYTISNDANYLPSDLDGSVAPLDGTPGYFLTYETLSSLRIWALAPNFANPNASTMTQTPDIAVSSFVQACGSGGTCIPQVGTSQQLDSLGDRPMYRLAFRNFGDHEALVFNHSVTAGSSVGVRWYELRAPVSTSVAFNVYQQGTYAPDSTFRWMGSAAQDSAGDIGIGYSASSTSIHPAIRYTGREAADPLNTLRAETSMIEGPGSQTGGLSRWGDYSAMRIDPSDDCTFWYTNEFLPSDGSFNWSTYFASFKYPTCGPQTADFSVSATPATQTVTQGTGTNYSATVTPSNGFTGNVTMSVNGLPTGANATFSPNPITGGSGSSSLSVTTSSTTPTGTYTLTITGTSAGLIHSTTVTLVVNSSNPPDFSISASPSTQTVTQGNGTSYTATVTPSNGFNGSVTLSASGLPSGAGATFSPNPITGGSGSSTMSVTTGSSTPPGTYTLRITGTNGSTSHSTTVTLVVNSTAGFSISASPSSQTVTQGNSTSYTATVTPSGGFNGSVTLSASGLPTGANASFSPNPISGGSGSSTMSVTTSSTTPTGTYTLRITGTNGSTSHSTTVTLVVNSTNPPGFSISASPSSQTVTRPNSTSYTVTVTATNGFNGTVAFSVHGLPSGSSASFSPTSVTGPGTSTMTVNTSTSTSTGTFTLRIRGSSGGTTHSTSVRLTVQ